jgi:methylated-DNA-protein-cysteine methyltransferase-like protein
MQYTKGVDRSEKYQRIYDIVGRIPEGNVATYGQIATLAGYPGQARQVGYALNALPEGMDIPWQRVINAKGQISPRANPIYEEIQQQILEAEGICFDEYGRVDLARFRWEPGLRK